MKIKELLDNPSKWAQGESAFSGDGSVVIPEDPKACKWCLLGAMEKCYGVGSSEYYKVLQKVSSTISPGQKDLAQCSIITIWNDREGRKFYEIKELVERLDV